MPQQSEERIRDIIHKLNGQGIMVDADREIKSMTGTTEGLVYIFTVNKEPMTPRPEGLPCRRPAGNLKERTMSGT